MIAGFSGEYRFLSNFYPSPIKAFKSLAAAPTVEHAYQAFKAQSWEDRIRVIEADSPGEAKKLGQYIALRHDWEAVKLSVMRICLILKFLPGTVLAKKLLDTGDEVLVELNTWGDEFWGKTENGGQNWLGHLLMARRAELKN